jgi:lysophospholipase L1-like esterase
MSVLIEDDALVLFQGDSITDAGRSRENTDDLGYGYANLAAAWLAAGHPDLNIRFLNRGISGNRVKDLRARWQEDCLALKPDWVSIMIGINDTWRAFDSNDPTPTEDYEADYRHLLKQVRSQLGARLILMEPFLLPTPPDRKAWRVDLDPRIHVVRTLACEFDAILVPLDGAFAEAATHRPPEFWAGDGVHPSHAGHALIARAWLATVGGL